MNLETRDKAEQGLGTCSTPRTKVAYIKAHKAGSCTHKFEVFMHTRSRDSNAHD